MIRQRTAHLRTLLVAVSFFPALAAAKTTEVNVVVDFTPEGRAIAHPTPGRPVFYYPVLAGFEELGDAEAGEKPPRQGDVARVVALELAKQGYLEMKPAPRVNAAGEVTYGDGTVVTVPAHPAAGRPLELNAPGDIPLTRAMLDAPESPYFLGGARSAAATGIAALKAADPVHGPVLSGTPELILFIQAGRINPEVDVAPSLAAGFTHPATSGVQAAAMSGPPLTAFVNQQQMFGLVAGNTLMNLDRGSEFEVSERAEQDRYFVMLSAYDFEAYRKSRKLVLLWQAKMSSPSDRLAQFTDALPALVAAGGPFFGRETLVPKTFILPVTPEGRVDVGALRTMEYSEAPPAPPDK